MRGDLASARRIVERIRYDRPNDPRVLIVLGRIYLAWPVWGRYQAESLFTRAAALDPANPEPFYYLGQVGLALRGDDGEMIARPALVRVLALNPTYRDAWPMWLRLYRADRERRDAVRALERHATGPAPLWRAQLLVELRSYPAAQALLDTVIAARPTDPAPRALLARALFEQGRDDEGERAYEGALRGAHRDTAGSLWLQVRSIASPAERERYDATPVAHREAWFRRFWARRDPDIRRPGNQRLGEHFRRYAEAQRSFALLHPNSRFHHSSAWRALSGGVGGLPAPDFRPVVAQAVSQGCIAPRTSVRDENVAAGGAPRTDRAATEETINLEDGLDDRGRVWVRYGKPDHRFVYRGDGETWCYNTAAGMLRVTFMRRTGGWGLSGDMVVTPVIDGEAESAGRLLASDRATPIRRELTFSFWPAAFRREVGTVSELVLFPDSVSATAVLIDDDGLEVARDSGTNRPLRLVARPGSYLVLMDGERNGRRGGFRGPLPVPAFPGGQLGVSSLLIASGDVPATRAALEAAAPPGLRLDAGAPLRVYAEVYGLQARGGAVAYTATYRFERQDRGPLGIGRRQRLTSVSFSRTLPAAESHIETLRIDPGRLPRGRYRLVLEIDDPVRGSRAASATMEFELR